MVSESQDAIPLAYYANDRNALRISLADVPEEDEVSLMHHTQRILRYWAKRAPEQRAPTVQHAERACYLMYSERSYALDAPLP